MTAPKPVKPQTLKIPAPAPWINANSRDHWTKKSTLTRSWRNAAAAWSRHQKMTPFTVHVVVIAIITKTTGRSFDVENLAPTVKAAIDDEGHAVHDARLFERYQQQHQWQHVRGDDADESDQPFGDSTADYPKR